MDHLKSLFILVIVSKNYIRTCFSYYNFFESKNISLFLLIVLNSIQLMHYYYDDNKTIFIICDLIIYEVELVIMTELLYQKDSYLREFSARVEKVNGNFIVLDRTAFNPRSGGLSCDTGYLVKDDNEYRVIEVFFERITGEVVHKLDSEEHNLNPGDHVKGFINWKRRYKIMRLHTAAHIISAILYKKYNALITGGHIYPDYAYDDYSLEKFDPEIFKNAIEEANDIVKQGIDVKIYWLKREDALKIPGIVKLASRMPPDIEILRIVEIPGIDIQADGGPHVKNVGEIGEIVFLKAVNKGKRKKRLYYTVKP